MNWRVSSAVISDPLSDHATRIGLSSPSSAGREPVGAEQPLLLERADEQQLRLGARLLAAHQVADPVSRDDVDDRVDDSLAPGEVGRVPDPDPVALPRNRGRVQANRPWDGTAPRATSNPVLERDAQQRRGRDEHHAGVAAAVRELAMRAIHRDPTPRSDRGSPAPRSSTADGRRRRPDGRPPDSPSRAAAAASDARGRRARSSTRHARVCAHPSLTAPGRSAPAARSRSRRSRARGPGRKARALPSPVQRQLDRHLLQRL